MHLLSSDFTSSHRLFICFSTLHIVGSLLFKLPSTIVPWILRDLDCLKSIETSTVRAPGSRNVRWWWLGCIITSETQGNLGSITILSFGGWILRETWMFTWALGTGLWRLQRRQVIVEPPVFGDSETKSLLRDRMGLGFFHKVACRYIRCRMQNIYR